MTIPLEASTSARRIVFPKPGQVELSAFELPELSEGQLRVRSHFSLMSIGTETTILHQRYDPGTHFDQMFSFPQLQTGVQTVGEIEATHPSVSEFENGDLVFIRKAHGSHHVVDDSECSPVPSGINPEIACWCGLAKTAFRAAWAGGLKSGIHLLVVGAGPVGQMVVRWAAALGCDSVAVIDVSPFRLQHAKAGGAHICIEGQISEQLHGIANLNGGAGPELVIDSTGNAEVFQSALAAAAQFGKVILLGDSGYPARQCLSSEVMTKGLTIQATHDSHDRDGWNQRAVDQFFFNKVSDEEFDLSGLITHEFSPEDCEQAYTLADTQRENTMGILFDWTAV